MPSLSAYIVRIYSKVEDYETKNIAKYVMFHVGWCKSLKGSAAPGYGYAHLFV